MSVPSPIDQTVNFKGQGQFHDSSSFYRRLTHLASKLHVPLCGIISTVVPHNSLTDETELSAPPVTLNRRKWVISKLCLYFYFF